MVFNNVPIRLNNKSNTNSNSGRLSSTIEKHIIIISMLEIKVNNNKKLVVAPVVALVVVLTGYCYWFSWSLLERNAFIKIQKLNINFYGMMASVCVLVYVWMRAYMHIAHTCLCVYVN